MSKLVGCENTRMSNACTHCIFANKEVDCNEFIELFKLEKVFAKPSKDLLPAEGVSSSC